MILKQVQHRKGFRSRE